MAAVPERILAMRARLDRVSPSFCLAKSLQSLIHLQNGQSFSCCKSAPHRVPVEEVRASSGALHNDLQRKRERERLRCGERIPECSYCWEIEEISERLVSDRARLSAKSWAEPEFDRLATLDPNADVAPTYLEVSFGNVCNFRCSYCDPTRSSRWLDEIRRMGPYPTSSRHNDLEHFAANGELPIPEAAHNPYSDAFWQWWPSLYPRLKTLRITGGEPMLAKDTVRVLDYIIEHPRPDLVLSINSNLQIAPAVLEAVVARLERITEAGLIRKFVLRTSVDGWGKQAEYIRNGMDFEVFWSTVCAVAARLRRIRLAFIAAFNVLSVPSFGKLLEEVLALKRTFAGPLRPPDSAAVTLDVNHLVFPHHQSVRLLPEEFQSQIESFIRFMRANPALGHGPGYSEVETLKMVRLLEWMRRADAPDRIAQLRRDFWLFFSEHDRRRGTDFTATFPELEAFWKLCQGPAEEQLRRQEIVRSMIRNRPKAG